MQEYKVEMDSMCPKVHFQLNGHFEITGKCITEHTKNFFLPILNWLEEYLKNPAPKTTLNMKVIYCNSFSKKYFTVIFSMLKTLKDKGFDSEVNWYYEKDDDDALDMVEIYQYSSEMEIKAIPFNPDE